jgi:hypothetical protein
VSSSNLIGNDEHRGALRANGSSYQVADWCW